MKQEGMAHQGYAWVRVWCRRVVQSIAVAFLLTGYAAAQNAISISGYNYSGSPAPITNSQTRVFTAQVGNAGPASEPGPIAVKLTIAPEMNVVLGSFPAFCTLSGGAPNPVGPVLGTRELNCNVPGPLGVGNSFPIQYTAQALIPTANTATTATITSSTSVGTPGLTRNVTIIAGADLAVTKKSSADSYGASVAQSNTANCVPPACPNAVAGSTLTYRLTVKNNGPDAVIGANKVRVVDSLPAGADLGSVSVPTGSPWACTLAGNVVSCDYTGANVAVGADYPALDLSGTVLAGGGTVSNNASVLNTDTNYSDPTPANDQTGNYIVNVTPGGDLRVSTTLIDNGTLSSTIVARPTASTSTLTLTATNAGPATATGNSPVTVNLTAQLAQGFTVGALPPGCTFTTPNLVCNANNLAVGTPQAFAVTLNNPTTPPPSVTAGTVTASIAAAPGFTESNTTNNTGPANYQLAPPYADLSVTKSKPRKKAFGGVIDNVMGVTNNGPLVVNYSATNPLVVVEDLPANETAASCASLTTPNGWTCQQVVGGSTLGGAVSYLYLSDGGTECFCHRH
jgi:large repetitive protein